MEHFVKELIGKSDLSILTTKAVRKAYEAHIQKTLSSDEKKKLKLLVNDILEEIAKTMKESSPRKSPRKVPSISASPVSSENIESRSDPQNLSENGDTASPKTVSETGSSSEISPPAKKSETKESRLPEVNLSETRETRSSPKKLLEDKTLQSTKPLKSPSKSSITANPKNAKRKNLSVREAVQSVLDSDKDEVGGVEINSESATDEEILVKKNKGHKRKLVSSDDDGEDITQDSDTSVVQLPVGKETSTPAKKPAAKKPLTKKQRILSEDESTDVNNSDILQDTLPEKKTAPKKPVPKSHVSSGDDSDDSGDDRLQIDVGVDESEDSNQGDSQTEPLDTSKSNPTAAIESGDTATSVEIVQSPGKKGKKKKKKKKNKKKSSVAVESDDAEMSMEVDEVPKKKGRKHQNENNDAEEEPLTGRYKVSLTELRKICRCAGILLRNTIELAGCQTDNEKRMKIFDILRERGMKGKPSMNKAETLKLKKEASELNTDNIISDSGRPQRRKVQSRYNKGGNPAADSPKKVTPLKLRLSGLWGIVDSEGSEST